MMIKRFLTKLRNFLIAPLRSDISGLSALTGGIRSDISGLSALTGGIRSDISGLSALTGGIYNKLIYDGRSGSYWENRRRFDDPLYLDGFGYKVYSQNDEDGIIQEIFRRVGTTNKIFVEFGVQDGLESNCHFLLFNGWRGLWIDGDENNVSRLREFFSKPLSEKRLTAINAFITTDNINKLIGEDGNVNGEIDVLSIDVDGNDYWIWEKIHCISPRVVIIEYNAKFPPPCEWVMEYDPNHIWDSSDKQGASLKSLELLGNRLGYTLVGTNTNGVNAFFVKKELTKNLFPEPATAENVYNAWGKWFVSSGHPTKRYIGK